jgi:hypothetical protein
VPWEELRGISFDPADLEPGDHLLTWGHAPEAHRYCHAFGAEEEERMIAALALELFVSFEVEDEPNRYFVFRSRASGAR